MPSGIFHGSLTRMPPPEMFSVMVVAADRLVDRPLTKTCSVASTRAHSRRWIRSASPVRTTRSAPAVAGVELERAGKRWMPRGDACSIAHLGAGQRA